MKILGPELDELFLSLQGTKFGNVMAAFEQIEAQREVAGSMTTSPKGGKNDQSS